MNNQRLFARGLAVVALACGGGVWLAANGSPAADGRATPRCEAGRTLQHNGSGRVYLASEEVYACARGVRRRSNLGAQWHPQVSSSGGGGVLRVAVNGRRVAYTSEHFQDPHGYEYATFAVRSIGRRRHSFHRVYGTDSGWYGSDVQALDLVLCAGGRIAFLVRYGGDPAAGVPATYDVRISKGSDVLLLDRGPDIEPGTLRATTGHVSWMNAGSARDASITCARPSASVAVPWLTRDDVFGEP